jgi:hypothetical protein
MRLDIESQHTAIPPHLLSWSGIVTFKFLRAYDDKGTQQSYAYGERSYGVFGQSNQQSPADLSSALEGQADTARSRDAHLV